MEQNLLTTEDMVAAGAALTAFGISMTIVITAFTIIALCLLLLFIASRIPYCKMAKREGISNRWLLWIPIGEMYIRLQLSEREYGLFGFIKLKERKVIFWIYLIFNVIMILAGMAFFVILLLTSLFPLVGIFVVVAMQLLWLFYYVVNSIIGWRVNYDILMTYGMEKHAMWASVVNCFIPCLMIVFSYIIMNQQPDKSV